MENNRNLIITEAKDCLNSINDGISKTRERSWQLIAFMIALDIYLAKLTTENIDKYAIGGLLVFALICSIYVFKQLYASLFPSTLRFAGAPPYGLDEDLKVSEEELYYSIIKTYHNSIKKNLDVLSDFKTGYKNALNSIIALVFVSGVFIILFYLLTERLMLDTPICTF